MILDSGFYPIVCGAPKKEQTRWFVVDAGSVIYSDTDEEEARVIYWQRRSNYSEEYKDYVSIYNANEVS